MRLIDADALIRKFKTISPMAIDGRARQIVEDMPTIEERKTGRWIESNPQNSEICRLINCSECGKGYIVNINVPYENWTEAHKFCVECGCKMEVDNE